MDYITDFLETFCVIYLHFSRLVSKHVSFYLLVGGGGIEDSYTAWHFFVSESSNKKWRHIRLKVKLRSRLFRDERWRLGS